MDKTYTDGLNDAWELAKKLWLPTSYGGKNSEEVMKIFGCDYYAISKLFTPQEALAKLEAYEKSKEIKAGDVVESINTGRIGIITKVEENGKYVMFSDGMAGMFAHDDIRKTGKHIDIQKILEQLKGGMSMKQFIDKLIGRLEEKFKYNSEQAEIYRDGSDKDAYFREKKDLYMDRANTYGQVMRIVNELAEEYNNDFCEWKFAKSAVNGDWFLRSGCNRKGFSDLHNFEFCPYCGKKIKVGE